MRIAISTEGPSLDAQMGERFGTAKYLLIVDAETGDLEAVPNPGASSTTHSGIQMVILVISRKPDVLLTGYLSPTAEKHLTSNGVLVMRGIAGKASEALDLYRQGLINDPTDLENMAPGPTVTFSEKVMDTVKKSARQIGGAMPVIIGVVLLMGLFQTFVNKGIIASHLSGKGLWDTLWGAVAGSLFAGNPINSYIIGGELLAQGVSLLAVTAFLVSWVTVGLLQLPAEMDALGRRFALTRNGLSFVASLCVAGATVATCRILFGGCL